MKNEDRKKIKNRPTYSLILRGFQTLTGYVTFTISLLVFNRVTYENFELVVLSEFSQNLNFFINSWKKRQFCTWTSRVSLLAGPCLEISDRKIERSSLHQRTLEISSKMQSGCSIMTAKHFLKKFEQFD